jgi:NAD-dependent SIR2 family protein deacetylase
VDDYRSCSRTKKSSRNIFGISALSSEKFARRIGALYGLCSRLQPTPFHQFLDELAGSARLLRHYTQNIDCLETSLDSLSSRTISLHGRLDMVICTYCQNSKHVPLVAYEDTVWSLCEKCLLARQARISISKRGTTVGQYRPKILLYGESCPDETAITTNFEHDLSENVEAVVIAGTRLQIPAMKRFARALCESAKSRGGIVIWVNREKPSLGKSFDTLFDYVLQGDCDDFV